MLSVSGWGLGFRVQGVGFRDEGFGSWVTSDENHVPNHTAYTLWFRAEGLRLRVEGLRFRMYGYGCSTVEGLEFRVKSWV